MIDANSASVLNATMAININNNQVFMGRLAWRIW